MNQVLSDINLSGSTLKINLYASKYTHTKKRSIQMNIQELATAVVNELPIIICIFNNSYLGNVRQWQEMFYQKHYSQTCLRRRKSCAAICNTPPKLSGIYS